LALILTDYGPQETQTAEAKSDGQGGDILHVDLIALRPEVGGEAKVGLIEAAAGLTSIEGVMSVSVIEAEGEASDFDLALLYLLRDFAALEPFGTDARYTRFLQGEVAPLLRGFAGADVRLDAALPVTHGWVVLLGLTAPAETYDWEIRERLAAWAGVGASSVSGLAVGERQRYRGIALAFSDGQASRELPAGEGAEASLISGRARRLA
jgi:hypothetical protein